jgi:hypothetical protein
LPKPFPKPFPAMEAIHTVAFDFDGVFTDNKVWVDQDGRESVRCDRGVGTCPKAQAGLPPRYLRQDDIHAGIFGNPISF